MSIRLDKESLMFTRSETFSPDEVSHKWYSLFKPDIDALGLGSGIHTAILIKLPAGKSIPTHIDAAPHFKLYKRIHIPIITNPQCLFTVGGETIHMKCGEMWEINNDTKPHSVHNKGAEDRVHLLVDIK